MELELRKITFLSLAQSLLSNDLKGIVKSNCIEFYHYLLDGLEVQKEQLLEQEDVACFVYDAVISLLENFPQINSQQVSDLIEYRTYVIEYLSEETSLEFEEVKTALQGLQTFALHRMTMFLSE
jgi:hypothetical protein